jgi:superfamily II DNA helicase RecQ
MAMLDTKAYDGSVSGANKRVVEMYSHIHSGLETEKRLLMEFPKKESVIRCLVSTVAFGMGINIPDIRYVVNWGVPSSVTTYWQEVGRCARDGQPGKAILYAFPGSINKALLQKEMLAFCDDALGGKCIRQSILCNFAENLQHNESTDDETCCSNCTK